MVDGEGISGLREKKLLTEKMKKDNSSAQQGGRGGGNTEAFEFLRGNVLKEWTGRTWCGIMVG